MDLQQDLGGLDLWDCPFYNGKAMEALGLGQAILACLLWDWHGGYI